MSPEHFQEEVAEEGSADAVHSSTLCREMDDFRCSEKVVTFKFGGSSVLGAERMLHAASLVRVATKTSRVTVVVSAMRGITDHLLSIVHALAEGKLAHALKEAGLVIQLHLDALGGLGLAEHDELRVRRELQILGRDLLLEVPAQGRVTPSAEIFDRLASFGERFSARLFAGALERSGVAAVPVASSDFIRTCENFRDAQPDLAESRRRGREILLPLLEDGLVPVVTGFIGATKDGRITTLGRNSSDFSGAILAHIVDAAELVIWTDVDGIFTANPKECAEAKLLHRLSYEEAHALAASGAKVLHAKVLPLAAKTEMVVWVRNTFNPQAHGTRIGLSHVAMSASQLGGAA